MRTRAQAIAPSALALTICLTGSALAADEPLSAIDWLVLRDPIAFPLDPPLDAPAESENDADLPDETTPPRISVPDVRVQPLDDASAAGVGLLPGSVTGLPATLWEGSTSDTLVSAIDALPVQTPLPAAQSLALALLLAEANPPRGDGPAFLAARLDALIRRGAISPARELAALLPPGQPTSVVTRQADIALLDGDTDAVCADILARPTLNVDLALRVYCLARAGDWDRAVTLLEAGFALGDIPQAQFQRLLRFLDPELAEELPVLPPPSATDLTPLDYRLLVATGEPLPAATLPLPFAVAEVSGDSGWKPQIEAAERLVRAGSMSEARLFGIYLERAPAASGGVWDRVSAFQTLDAALLEGAPAPIADALEIAWPLFLEHGLAVPLAREVGPRLQGLTLPTSVQDIAGAAMLLARDYEALVAFAPGTSEELRFAKALAAGDPQAAVPEGDAQARALVAAWILPPPPAPAPGMLGDRLLDTLQDLDAGMQGNLRLLTSALRQLRALGLEDVARRAALELRLAVPPA